MIRHFKGIEPVIAEGVFVAETASVVGDVTVGKDSSIWYGTVIRADVDKVVIGERTNVQDGSILHENAGQPLIVGNDVTVGHGAMLHACVVEDHCLIGSGAIVLDGCVIGRGSVIAAGALVPPNHTIPPFSMVMGVPGKIVRQLDEEESLAARQAHANRYIAIKNNYL